MRKSYYSYEVRVFHPKKGYAPFGATDGDRAMATAYRYAKEGCVCNVFYEGRTSKLIGTVYKVGSSILARSVDDKDYIVHSDGSLDRVYLSD